MRTADEIRDRGSGDLRFPFLVSPPERNNDYSCQRNQYIVIVCVTGVIRSESPTRCRLEFMCAS